jgi:hypothetical protein
MVPHQILLSPTPTAGIHQYHLAIDLSWIEEENPGRTRETGIDMEAESVIGTGIEAEIGRMGWEIMAVSRHSEEEAVVGMETTCRDNEVEVEVDMGIRCAGRTVEAEIIGKEREEAVEENEI